MLMILGLREEEGIPELEDEEEKHSFHASEESEDSEDEFDDPPVDTLVRSFENLNRVQDHVVSSASSAMPSTGSVTSELNGSVASTFLKACFSCGKTLVKFKKASWMVRREYDVKRTILRQLESKGEHSSKIDKTRAVVKDLHSRIRVAIHRIDSISKRIEELRDKELQPQLEELIDGLSRMWVVMFECHKLQFHIISIAYTNGSAKISIQSESHRQIVILLENELNSLSSCFTKWIGAQKSYLQAINDWLFKCVLLPEKPTKKKRKQQSPSLTLRRSGPPIYVTCGTWLDKLEALPAKQVVDATKGLAGETAHLLPRQEKNQGKSANPGSWKADNGSDSGINMLKTKLQKTVFQVLSIFDQAWRDFLAS
ncbi:hypothetical protein GH714_008106 [Hevea brasiliensis]|uniref:DUF632 domain-containing protein n=1 Tax=Hevea brasiliensis TaxID=3981 RepID=A0A6A6LGE0_HEVBR|nr:hypothetical protein GH714_008106 [Hevea brasiliensis]